MKPSCWPTMEAREFAVKGNLPTFTLYPASRALVSVRPTLPISGWQYVAPGLCRCCRGYLAALLVVAGLVGCGFGEAAAPFSGLPVGRPWVVCGVDGLPRLAGYLSPAQDG